MSHIHRFSRSLGLLLALCLLTAVLTPPVFAAPREGLLVVAFGTSVPEAMPAFRALDTAFRAEFPGMPLEWAYTSQRIRKKLARQGKPVGGISDGLAALARKGVNIVRVQSLHVMAGEEFSALERAVLLDIKAHPGRFQAVYLGRPLLESRRDAEDVAAAVLGGMAARREGGDGLVLMGHGQEHGRADLVLEGMRATLADADPLTVIASVEGSRDLDDLVHDLRARQLKTVWLQPFMVVAGDHARNDLAGPEADSWASRLRREGFEVRANLVGLGEIPGVRAVFVRHAREAHDDLCKEPVKQ
ncbi:sirohydrochlorin cobaltochelatase [uncultured Desulfovibrio sp.]|uniref:Sirohydrochlorin cobaltochelatase n=1 Tax=Candidatus Desulfovibrio intestinavium TaxID=2838534 RepID=A0A9D2HN49_9BACT|nr:sirohydrochlorin cobaltochelatase [uncultured Desulfovibrio sp.]HJA78728.1 sirohydrochlorin cobaltochelatase [Candidatus Desulfovibrio intestinavium]